MTNFRKFRKQHIFYKSQSLLKAFHPYFGCYIWTRNNCNLQSAKTCNFSRLERTWEWGLVLRVCARSVRVWNARVTSSACVYPLLWWVRALCALHILRTRHHTQVLVIISLFLALSSFPLYWHWRVKGSVERSMLPWAIFLKFARNRPWKSEDHLCTLFLLKCQRKDSKKSETTPPVSWRPWAGIQPQSTVQLFMPVSGVEKPQFLWLWCVICR